MFSTDLGADLAADTQLQEILLERFEQCIITDHHRSFEVDLIDENKTAYINLNDEKDANYYSGAFTSALVFNQIFQTQTTPLENELIAITLLSDPRLSVFNVKEFKRYNDIKKKMVKENEESTQVFSYNKILVAILDESCSVKWGISGLVANNFLKKYPFNRSLCIYKDNKDGYSGSARGDGDFLSQIKTIPLIQAGGYEEAFGLSFAKEDFKKVVKSLQTL
ncbi:hypothetical protein HpCK6_03880 [Helicobacter pylori]